MNTIILIQVIVFVLGTIFLIYVSRKSLLSLKRHGFYRFFVFESCLLLILLNFPYWFQYPFLPLQIISWIFLIISIYLVFQSVLLFKKVGGNKEREKASANYRFEDTVNLIKDGIYKYIRHPMYGSLLFLSTGTFLKNISVWTLLLTIISVLFLILTAKTEEKENIEFFGPSYTKYMEETKMFIPFVF